MRENHCVGQRYVNHHRLAKRVSAFGLALAVVCGCLTPVFASQPEPAAAKDTAGAAAMDGGIARPVADGSVAVEDDLQGLYRFVRENARNRNEETLAAMEAAGGGVQVLALSTCSTEYTDARTILLTWMHPSASDTERRE